MARYARRVSAPRREWLVPGLFSTTAAGRAPTQVDTAADWNLPLGGDSVGDNGTKIHANGLVRPQQTRDPTDPPGVASVSHPLGPYTIERIVGSIMFTTDNTHIRGTVGTAILGVFDTGNPYEAAGTTPSYDRLRTQEGVMHCAIDICTADSSGPAAVNTRIDVRTKRVVVPGKSFYIIVHGNQTEDATLHYWVVLKVLVRYAS